MEWTLAYYCITQLYDGKDIGKMTAISHSQIPNIFPNTSFIDLVS